MENGFFTVDYESMAGVVTTLVAHNIFSPFSQEIDDLPLPSSPIGCPVRRRCYPFFKITVCLKMDSTIAFSELQHFLHSKMTSISLFFVQPIVFLNM